MYNLSDATLHLRLENKLLLKDYIEKILTSDCSRMINAGGSKNLQVVITDLNGRIQTNSCDVWEIAIDGMYLNEPRKPKLGRSFITSSARVEWIVVCHNPGVYKVTKQA